MSNSQVAQLADQVANLSLEEKYELITLVPDLLKLDEQFILSRRKEALEDKTIGKTIDAFKAVETAKARKDELSTENVEGSEKRS